MSQRPRTPHGVPHGAFRRDRCDRTAHIAVIVRHARGAEGLRARFPTCLAAMTRRRWRRVHDSTRVSLLAHKSHTKSSGARLRSRHDDDTNTPQSAPANGTAHNARVSTSPSVSHAYPNSRATAAASFQDRGLLAHPVTLLSKGLAAFRITIRTPITRGFRQRLAAVLATSVAY